MNRKALFLCIIFLFFLNLYSESIVPGGFTGHLRSGEDLAVGDILLIEITQDLQLKINSTRTTSNSSVFELTGGVGSDLLSFLPTGQTSSSRSIKSEESVELKTMLPVRIEQINNGIAAISGSRSINADGGSQYLLLTGSIPIASISNNSAINFNSILNSELTYRYVASPGDTSLTEDDLKALEKLMPDETNSAAEVETDMIIPEATTETVITEGPAVDENAEVTAVDEITENPVIGNDMNTIEQSSGYSLSEERKKELFLKYINEFMRLMFM